MEAGQHSIDWNGDDNSGQSVASGIYFYKFQTADHNDMGKCILLK